MKTKISTTREYAEMLYALHTQGTMNKVGASLYAKILRTGNEFNEVDTVQSRRLKKEFHCKLGQCYYNAQKIMIQYPMCYRYYEGWVGYIIPLEHGWLVDRNTGLVVDPTMSRVKKKGDYFGISIPKKFINEVWNEEQMARQLIWDHLLASVNGRKNGN